MAQTRSSPRGPDLSQGVALEEFVNEKLAGHVGGEEVLLVYNETGIFAIAAHCSHYHGPLIDGLTIGPAPLWGRNMAGLGHGPRFFQ